MTHNNDTDNGAPTTPARSKGVTPHTKMRQETYKRRDDILQAATEVFGTQGYYKGSLADIAKKVGMTHAGVLHHFGSKRELLIETLRYRDGRGALDIVRLPLGQEMFEHLAATAALNAERPGIVQTYVVSSAESVTDGAPSREYFRHRFATLRQEIADNLDSLGCPSHSRSVVAASSILAIMDGLQLQWLLAPEEVCLPEDTRSAIEAIVNWALSDDN